MVVPEGHAAIQAKSKGSTLGKWSMVKHREMRKPIREAMRMLRAAELSCAEGFVCAGVCVLYWFIVSCRTFRGTSRGTWLVTFYSRVKDFLVGHGSLQV